ncbi:retrotransposon ORF1 [Tanacetum coccineum]
MAYSDKYKKRLDGICLDKIKLDGIRKEEEEAIIKIKGEALIEKEDPGAFVIPIRLEGKINLNALVDTGSDINVMPYCVYKELGKEEVGVTTIIAKFLILDMPIDRDTPILVGRGFMHTCRGILNTIDNITSSFDRICQQTFRAAKTSLDTAESDGDDEEEYAIQRKKFGAPIYRTKHGRYLNGNDLLDRSLALQEVLNPFRKICVWKKVVSFLGSLHVALQHVEWKPDYTGCFNRREDSDGQCFLPLLETIFSELRYEFLFQLIEFYSTYEFDEVCADDELKTKKIIKFRLGGRAHSLTLLEFARRLGLYHAEELDEEGFDVYFQGGLRSDEHFNTREYWLSISREENMSLSRSHDSTI